MTEQASKLMKEHYDFKDLVALMELLRSEEGCPWDRAQTHESIRKNLIEECYEAIEGIDRKDDELLCEELGDILLQVVFHAQIETAKRKKVASDPFSCDFFLFSLQGASCFFYII